MCRASLLLSLLLLTAACGKKDPAATAKAADAAPPAPPAPDASPPRAVVTVENVGLQTPESVLALPGQDVYLVSNINGDPFAADDNGYISKLSPDGKLIELEWIDGAASKQVTLNAPKGMAVRDGELWVADIDTVRVFELASGKPLREVRVKGASFLNDVAAAGDKVYVTDSGLKKGFEPSGTDALYIIDATAKKGAEIEQIAGKQLLQPNGVIVEGDQIWVVSFAGNELYRLADGQKVDVATLPTGGLDGLVALGDGRVAVTSWQGKAVYVGAPAGPFTAVAEGVPSPADLGVDRERKLLLVPLFEANAVKYVPY